MLRERFGAERVVAFGSLARGDVFTFRSDVDLAVWGVPPHLFYRAVAAATGISSEFEVDLVDPGDCAPGFRRRLAAGGVSL